MKQIAFNLVFIILTVTGSVLAQIPQTDMGDAFDELEGMLNLYFFNALDGKPIANGSVTIMNIDEFQTDYEGKISFGIPERDTIYKVLFKKDGYIDSEFQIEIMAGTIFFNRFSVSPKLPFGALRAVLDWDANPGDLDAHLIKKNCYHISYHQMRISDDKVSRLDRDDMNGYGPETITTTKIDDNAEYLYLVHDYTDRARTDSQALSKSKAAVKIYSNDQLLYVLKVPANVRGNYWQVFKIVKGEIVILNTISGTISVD
jgi:hypothetical protein